MSNTNLEALNQVSIPSSINTFLSVVAPQKDSKEQKTASQIQDLSCYLRKPHKKNTIVLLGQAPEERTNIMQKFANYLAQQDDQKELSDCVILQLNVQDLVDSVDSTNQLKYINKLNRMIEFVIQNPKYILFIDDIDTLVEKCNISQYYLPIIMDNKNTRVILSASTMSSINKIATNIYAKQINC